jgi:hypothetical protein
VTAILGIHSNATWWGLVAWLFPYDVHNIMSFQVADLVFGGEEKVVVR